MADMTERDTAFAARLEAMRAYQRHEQTCATCRGASRHKRVGARCVQGQALGRAITQTARDYDRATR